MAGRGSLSTVPSEGGFRMEPTGPLTGLDGRGAGGGRCLA